jgi:WD40 repeat protein
MNSTPCFGGVRRQSSANIWPLPRYLVYVARAARLQAVNQSLLAKDSQEKKTAADLAADKARKAADAAISEQASAERARDDAIVDRLSSEAGLRASGSDLDLATALATEALRRRPTNLNASEVLQHTLFLVRKQISNFHVPSAGVGEVAFFHGHAIGSTFDREGRTSVIDMDTHNVLFSGVSQKPARLSPDGSYVVVYGPDQMTFYDFDRRVSSQERIVTGKIFNVETDGPRVATVFESSQAGLTRIRVVQRNNNSAQEFDFNGTVSALAIVPGRESVAIGDIGGSLRLRNLTTQTEILAPSKHSQWAMQMSCSNDAVYCASVWADKTVRLWNLHSNTEQDITQKGTPERPVFSNNSKTVAVFLADAAIGSNFVQVWDVGSGSLIAQIGLEGRPTSAAFAPDDAQLLVGTESDKLIGGGGINEFHDGRALIFDLVNRRLLSLPHSATVNDFVFNANGTQLATRQIDLTICTWDLRQLSENCAPMSSSKMAFTHAGNLISADSGQLIVRDVASGRVVLKGERDTQNFGWVTFSGDGSRFFCFAGLNLEVFDMKSGNLIASPSIPSTGVQIAADHAGSRIVFSSRVGRAAAFVFDVNSGTVRGPFSDSVWVYISGNGQRAITAADNGMLSVWDLNTLGRITTLMDPAWFGSVALSPDGNEAAVLGTDLVLRIWDVKTGSLIGRFPNFGLPVPFKPDGKIEFSPDGTMIATISDHVVRLHPWRTSELIRASCELLDRDLTRDEWIHFVGSEPYRPVCLIDGLRVAMSKSRIP